MKNIAFAILLLFAATAAFSQPDNVKALLPYEGSDIIYKGTVNGIVLDKEALFYEVEQWYAGKMKLPDNKLTLDNRNEGRLAGMLVVRFEPTDKEGKRSALFNLDISIGDSSYSYRLYNIKGISKVVRFSYSDMYREEVFRQEAKDKFEPGYRKERLLELHRYVSSFLNQMMIELPRPAK